MGGCCLGGRQHVGSVRRHAHLDSDLRAFVSKRDDSACGAEGGITREAVKEEQTGQPGPHLVKVSPMIAGDPLRRKCLQS